MLCTELSRPMVKPWRCPRLTPLSSHSSIRMCKHEKRSNQRFVSPGEVPVPDGILLPRLDWVVEPQSELPLPFAGAAISVSRVEANKDVSTLDF